MDDAGQRRHAAQMRRAFPMVQINGWSLREISTLRYDEVRLDRTARVAIVGEIRHVVYQADMNAIKEAMRRDVALIIAEFRESIESWGVSDPALAPPLEDR